MRGKDTQKLEPDLLLNNTAAQCKAINQHPLTAAAVEKAWSVKLEQQLQQYCHCDVYSLIDRSFRLTVDALPLDSWASGYASPIVTFAAFVAIGDATVHMHVH